MNAYKWLRPLLWTLDPERAHDLALALLGRAGSSPTFLRALRRRFGPRDTPALRVEAFGLNFPNVVGLAAGLDKDGQALPGLAALGFGFLEAGTVTPRPQPGNPKPRLWRLPRDRALVNRLGFNNAGAEALADRLRRAGPLPVPLGVNIGKNAATPLARAVDDYRFGLERLHRWADYVAINVSSPNTPGLRALQHRTALEQLLAELRRAAEGLPRRPPLLLKVAPDLTPAQLDDVVEASLSCGVAGLIAVNSTVARTGLTDPRADRPGGLSGGPLAGPSNRVVAALYRRLRGRIPVVGVGGIMDEADAYAKIKAGATLLQTLTGFVYGGPSFPRRLAEGLQEQLLRDGFRHVSEAVGVEAHRYGEPSPSDAASRGPRIGLP